MKYTELLMWLGIVLMALLLVALALVMAVVIFSGVVSVIGWVYGKIIRWRIKHSRNNKRRSESGCNEQSETRL